MTAPPTGDWGEQLAAEHLVRMGWTVVARNYRLGHAEIDLIARRGRLVAFVEVKTRSTERFGHPFEAITAGKRRKIARVSESWIARFGEDHLVYRYDAIAIDGVVGAGLEDVRVQHVEDAWGV